MYIHVHAQCMCSLTLLIEDDVLNLPLIPSKRGSVRVRLQSFGQLTLEVEHLTSDCVCVYPWGDDSIKYTCNCSHLNIPLSLCREVSEHRALNTEQL